MNWTRKQLDEVSKKLTIENPEVLNTPNSGELKSTKTSKEKEHIQKVLWVLLYEKKITNYETEYKFHPTRKWRFDWAIPELKTAIEYEGIISEKSGHTTINGYTKDCNKYNEATKLGWKVLRYTAKNYNNIASDLEDIIKKA